MHCITQWGGQFWNVEVRISQWRLRGTMWLQRTESVLHLATMPSQWMLQVVQGGSLPGSIAVLGTRKAWLVYTPAIHRVEVCTRFPPCLALSLKDPIWRVQSEWPLCHGVQVWQVWLRVLAKSWTGRIHEYNDGERLETINNSTLGHSRSIEVCAGSYIPMSFTWEENWVCQSWVAVEHHRCKPATHGKHTYCKTCALVWLTRLS